MFPEDRFLELLIIGALALIVVGPKDLPILMRKVGRFVAKIRGMAAEFRASFDELARQSELDELRREVDALRRGQQAAMTKIETPLRTGAAELLRDPEPPPAAAAEPEPGPAPAEATSAPDQPAPKPAPRKPRARAAKPKTSVAAAKAASDSAGGAS